MYKKLKIVLTGGHAATTALAVVEELNSRHGVFEEIHWIGNKRAVEGKRGNTLEFQVLPLAGVKCHSLIMGRLQRKLSWWTLPSILKIPVGFFQALVILTKIRPQITLSFGGAASFPVVFWSAILGIPVFIHEQTAVAGRANQVCANFAKKILLARSSSLVFFPKDKCTVVGNPILKIYFHSAILPKPSSSPTVFITGGSRGSGTINNLVTQSLNNLADNFKIIHQVGGNNLNEFKPQKNYLVVGTLTPQEMYKMYSTADIVVARAGANTVAEIIALKKPALLIPIPWSYLDEQTENAKVAVEFGVAEILKQSEATSGQFITRISMLLANRDLIAKKTMSKNSPDKLAAHNLVDILLTFLAK